MLTSWLKVKHLVSQRSFGVQALTTVLYFLAWWLKLWVQAADESTHGGICRGEGTGIKIEP